MYYMDRLIFKLPEFILKLFSFSVLAMAIFSFRKTNLMQVQSFSAAEVGSIIILKMLGEGGRWLRGCSRSCYKESVFST